MSVTTAWMLFSGGPRDGECREYPFRNNGRQITVHGHETAIYEECGAVLREGQPPIIVYIHRRRVATLLSRGNGCVVCIGWDLSWEGPPTFGKRPPLARLEDLGTVMRLPAGAIVEILNVGADVLTRCGITIEKEPRNG